MKAMWWIKVSTWSSDIEIYVQDEMQLYFKCSRVIYVLPLLLNTSTIVKVRYLAVLEDHLKGCP